MPGTTELRSIYSGPIRRALTRLDARINNIEGSGGVPGPPGPPGPPGDDGGPGPPGPLGSSYRQLVGGALTQVVTHNLGSRDVQVEVYRNADPWDRIDCDILHTDANTVTVGFLNVPPANGYVVNVILGTPGSGGAQTLGYTHVQSSPASVWTVNHTLTFEPNVSIVDSANDEVEGDVRHVSATQLVLTFTAAFSGKAYLS